MEIVTLLADIATIGGAIGSIGYISYLIYNHFRSKKQPGESNTDRR